MFALLKYYILLLLGIYLNLEGGLKPGTDPKFLGLKFRLERLGLKIAQELEPTKSFHFTLSRSLQVIFGVFLYSRRWKSSWALKRIMF